jgi:Uma2 family endonuclease
MNSPVIEKPITSETSYVLLYNVTWEQLEKLDADLEGTGARLTYLDGILEIMSPLSYEHEESKSTVSSLVEAYMREKKIRFYMCGSTTIGKKADKIRREPDESYNLGTKKPLPDLIIEITVTSGGIDKLEVYQRLQIPEVWFWEDGLLKVYSFQNGEYQQVTQSLLLPDLDLEMIASYFRMADQYDAINDFIQAIREN